MSKLSDTIAETKAQCASALASEPLSRVSEKLNRAPGNFKVRVSSLIGSGNVDAAVRKLAAQIDAQGDIAPARLQRSLLLGATLESLDILEAFPLETSVKFLICEEFQFFANPAERELPLFAPEKYSFLALAKISILERYPAGQFHWEVSGFPRSWMFKVPPADFPRLAYFLGIKLGGFAPCFFPHMATRRKNPLMLLEKESDKSWFRMAVSAQLFPGIRGLVASSWLHSPDTYRVSPHLSFINKPFVESGGLVTTMGEADQSAGYMVGSAQRRQMLENGKFQPTLGLVLWSRKQMAQWAEMHPELAQPETGAIPSSSSQLRSRT